MKRCREVTLPSPHPRPPPSPAEQGTRPLRRSQAGPHLPPKYKCHTATYHCSLHVCSCSYDKYTASCRAWQLCIARTTGSSDFDVEGGLHLKTGFWVGGALPDEQLGSPCALDFPAAPSAGKGASISGRGLDGWPAAHIPLPGSGWILGSAPGHVAWRPEALAFGESTPPALIWRWPGTALLRMENICLWFSAAASSGLTFLHTALKRGGAGG